jgi:hypothetical protein
MCGNVLHNHALWRGKVQQETAVPDGKAIAVSLAPVQLWHLLGDVFLPAQQWGNCITKDRQHQDLNKA